MRREQSDKGSQLRMVIIRARSALEVKQLRDMKLNIIRIKPDPTQPSNRESLSGGFIIEVVVSQKMITRLKAKKFNVSEVPERENHHDDSPP